MTPAQGNERKGRNTWFVIGSFKYQTTFGHSPDICKSGQITGDML